jgi:CBS domain-containing protein
MKVFEILKAKGSRVATVPPNAAVKTALKQMQAENIGALVVSRDGQSILGILSERDVVRCLVSDGAAVLDKTAAEIMSHPVHTCMPDDHVKRIMAEMTVRRVRHMPVIDEGRLAGIISIGDVVKSRLDEVELEAGVLRDAYVGAYGAESLAR